MSRIMGGPDYSFTVHGIDCLDSPRQNALKLKTENAKFAIAVSHYAQAQLRYWTESSKWSHIRVVGCTLSEAYFSREPLSERTHRLIFVGRLSAEKGLLTLLEAMSLIRGRCEAFDLTIVGDGPLRAQLESMVEQLDLTDRVELVGWRTEEEIRSILIGADGLVAPSYSEGLPVVLMEAMALSRPVISTYIAGIPELVEHQRSGWLVPAADPIPLRDALIDFSDASLNRLNDYGARSYELCKSMHSASIEIPKLVEAFRCL